MEAKFVVYKCTIYTSLLWSQSVGGSNLAICKNVHDRAPERFCLSMRIEGSISRQKMIYLNLIVLGMKEGS